MLTATKDFPISQRVEKTYQRVIPKTIIADPISWFPGKGYFRNSAPEVALELKVATGTNEVTAKSMTLRSAFSLGAARGMAGPSTSHGHPAESVANSFFGFSDVDLNTMSRLGYALWRSPQLTGRGLTPEVHTVIARSMAASLGYNIPADNEWRDVLLRIGAGNETEADIQFVSDTDYSSDVNPHNYTGVCIAKDALDTKQSDGYFAGLKRFASSLYAMTPEERQNVLNDAVRLFESLVARACTDETDELCKGKSLETVLP